MTVEASNSGFKTGLQIRWEAYCQAVDLCPLPITWKSQRCLHKQKVAQERSSSEPSQKRSFGAEGHLRSPTTPDHPVKKPYEENKERSPLQTDCSRASARPVREDPLSNPEYSLQRDTKWETPGWAWATPTCMNKMNDCFCLKPLFWVVFHTAILISRTAQLPKAQTLPWSYSGVETGEGRWVKERGGKKNRQKRRAGELEEIRGRETDVAHVNIFAPSPKFQSKSWVITSLHL